MYYYGLGRGMGYGFDWTYLLLIAAFILSMIVQVTMQNTFSKYSRVGTRSGMTGAQVAQMILQSEGLNNVTVQPVAGSLTDHYDPRTKTVNLSQTVFGATSLAAQSVAAHECGHAIQHAEAYPLLMLRKALVPVCNIGSMGSYVAILLGFLFSSTGLITLGAVLFSGIVLFNLVTLPVEADASRRALREVERLGILTDDEMVGGKKVLIAAGMTYFISLVTSIVQLLRLLSLARRK